jgi:hypothetical protein
MNSKLNDTIVDLTGLISVEIGLEMNNYFACLFIFFLGREVWIVERRTFYDEI